MATGNPIEALRAIESLSAMDSATRSTVVMLGLAGILDDPQSKIPALQALWNLRDALPQQGVLLVFTVPMGWRNPYPNDVAVAGDELPARQELIGIVTETMSNAKLTAPNDDLLQKSADALVGLSAFAAEQAIAMSISKSGLDLAGMWARKRQQIGETAGLSVYSGGEKFADLGGVAAAKQMFGRIIAGKRKPGAIVYIDEIEKSLAGSGGDTSGVSQSMLGYLLSYMQDSGATGSIFVGPPGAAKSALAKAIGTEAEIPTVQLDLGGIKGSLVGESESKMRSALAVITAISAGRPLFVATCNAIATLPPELRRRFTLGTMFFDLPTPEERAKIWPIYLKRFDLNKQPLPDCEGWTGAEIRQCADLADRFGCSLLEAAKSVVPVSVSAREAIERLRSEASGRYLNAAQPGIYSRPEKGAASVRKMDL